MALRHLFTKAALPALRRASAPGPSLATGARALSYRSSNQGSNPFQDSEDLIERLRCLEENHRRVFQILDRELDKQIKLLHEEWNSFESIVRRDMQDLARFRKKTEKLAGVAAAVGLVLEARWDQAGRIPVPVRQLFFSPVFLIGPVMACNLAAGKFEKWVREEKEQMGGICCYLGGKKIKGQKAK